MGKCKSCANRKRLYRKSMSGYYADKKYYCTERETMTDNGNGCERWERKGVEIDLSKARFDKAVEDLGYFAQIFTVRQAADRAETCKRNSGKTKDNATYR